MESRKASEKKAKFSAYMREYNQRNREKVSEQRKARYAKDPSKDKERSSEYRLKNPEKVKVINAVSGAKYRSANKHKEAEKTSRYRNSKINRTPIWLTNDHLWMIEEIYHLAKLRTDMTKILHHVDHIVPLQGDTVSGLHVPWNLQVITAIDNWRKNNQFA